MGGSWCTFEYILVADRNRVPEWLYRPIEGGLKMFLL